ncbi:superfamily I DNA and RNA helicase [Deinobacterium chartae]|uniref:Superfamily I DNA and RNA helicase n=1 Tax=Deinobacterium chartae TaxID=521158 RepID=A0A841I5W7_9DEIO|nr:nuclease-related domain-containing DEAD/DEAH box helicase [Deinobacterium chartae]MBB6099659.1 superfamily I DNA and RNA helicase [Deinobacterium chartae]
MSDFIVTEPFGLAGETGEARVFDAVKQAFSRRNALGFWRYPIVTRSSVKEPDILIADPEYGVVILEVKSLPINHLEGIYGYRWNLRVPYFGRHYMNPFEQARQQVQALLDRMDGRPELGRVPARALVALPLIARQEWEAAGFDQLLNETPLLFADELTPGQILRAIERTPRIRYGEPLDDAQWQALRRALGTGDNLPSRGAAPVTSPAPATMTASPPRLRRADLIERVRAAVREFDLQQEQIAKTIPPGPQRIRGIAGSGKTVLLAQKAANMHLKHPDWDIALVFFCRSLYDQIRTQVDHWLRHGSGGDHSLETARGRLRILHAWGSKDQPGFYRTLAEQVGVPPLNVGNTPDGSPTHKLLYACKALLGDAQQLGRSLQMFDAVLIDEGQDLVHESEALRFEEKQAFYWLAYQSLKPVHAETPLFGATPLEDGPELRRLIWAYDEAQSLDTLAIPSTRALFGTRWTEVFGAGASYPGGIQKSQVMHRCYRTPGPILVAAHALGMGLLREQGMLAGLTNAQDWRAIGYEVDGYFRSGSEVVLYRPRENSPGLLEDLSAEPLITFDTYPARQAELEALCNRIAQDLQTEGLEASRNLLVVVLGEHREARMLQAEVFAALRRAGHSVYIPGNRDTNILHQKWPQNDPNGFWRPGAITVSPVMQAKGNEADVVYVVGVDHVAKAEDDLRLRNQLFVALSRSRGWAVLSGAGCSDSSLSREIRRVLEARGYLKFLYRPPRRQLDTLEAD